MDMLVVVGTSVSYLYSTLALLLACSLPGDQGDHRPHLFLESPAMLLTFIALGRSDVFPFFFFLLTGKTFVCFSFQR